MYDKMTVMLTRPRELAEPLGERLSHQGNEVIYFPTIQIMSNPIDEWAFEQGPAYDLTIFTSRNAVTHGAYFASQANKLGQILAVGTATQAELANLNLNDVKAPVEKFCSESLLKLPELQSVKDKRIMVVTGHAPRNFLVDELTERGADVTTTEVYKRRCPHVKFAKILNKHTPECLHAIVFHSASSIYNFVTMMQTTQHSFLDCPVVVVSKRIAGVARDIGFTNVSTADDVTDDAVMTAIANASTTT